MSPTVLFLHGLESSPQGHKARWLAEHRDGVAPALDTSALIRLRAQAEASGRPLRPGDPRAAAAFAGPLATARQALARHRPRVVVGSSFGGAVAVALRHEDAWTGPTILLAPAVHRILGPVGLGPGGPVWVVQGLADTVVPATDSRALVAGTDPAWVHLIELDDDHRLGSLLTTGLLGRLVDDALAAADTDAAGTVRDIGPRPS